MQTLGKSIINAVAGVILYPYLTSSVGDATERNTVVGSWNAKSFLDHLNHLEKMVCSGSESEGAENIQSSLNYISSITCPLRHYCYSSFEPKYYLRRWSRNYFRFIMLFF
jgi:hypothetical protein